MDLLGALKKMMQIRAFEAALAARHDHGFQLLSAGEEAVAVGLASALGKKDQLLTGGRSIGPALARGVEPGKLMAELLGSATGINRGRAGRGHLSDPVSGFFGAHAVVGGNISVAAGVALAQQLEGNDAIVAVLFGDGACGAGVLHETLNIAANWKLPLLFVCSNNQMSVSTTRREALAPDRLSDLGASFRMPSVTLDGLNVEDVFEGAQNAIKHVRSGAGPAFVECVSVRMLAHSTTARESRDRDQLRELRACCPIKRLASRLGLSASEIDLLEREAFSVTSEAMAYADASAYPNASEVFVDV